MTYDGERSGKVYVAVNTLIWGPYVEISPDMGQTWVPASQPPRFSGGGSETVERIWHIEPAGSTEPGVLYAGVQPAALFKSTDEGDTW